jgi:glycosyltransferase involved in cell wall biosynthesis
MVMDNNYLIDWRGRTILLVLRTLEMGGTQRQVGYLAPWLQRHTGARVVVWALERGGQLTSLLERHGIEWEVHNKLLRHHGAAKLPALLGLLWRIRRLHPDVILSFNDFPNKVCGALWPWTRAKICIWNQRDEGREITGRFLERRALRHVPLFIANSSQGADFLARQFTIARNYIVIIPNGVQLDPPKSNRVFWRNQLRIAPQTVVATMVASLHHFKDHETLLRAWALVQKENTPFKKHLVLIGRQEDTHAFLVKLCADIRISESVHFLGFTDDISGLLEASDIGVFSSQCEGMPNGVLECMAAGLPVVATNIIGVVEALGADYPLLVTPGDASALAESLLTLIHDKELRHRLGEQNQKRTHEEFSVKRMGQRYIDLLNHSLLKPLGKLQ